MRVLIAEDDAVVAASLGKQLEELGHHVVGEAADGREAVKLAASLQPEAIVMDIAMPDLDGIGAAREIARQCPRPVIFLSGFFDEALLHGVVEAGGMAYLLKPATASQLGAALSLAVQRFGEMGDLRQQVTQLNEALETRKLVARAKGTLMERHGWTEQEAHRTLQKEASSRNMKLADLAQAILTAEAVGEGAREGPAI
jgi:AmiR/NasT family two-component response regulator